MSTRPVFLGGRRRFRSQNFMKAVTADISLGIGSNGFGTVETSIPETGTLYSARFILGHAMTGGTANDSQNVKAAVEIVPISGGGILNALADLETSDRLAQKERLLLLYNAFVKNVDGSQVFNYDMKFRFRRKVDRNQIMRLAIGNRLDAGTGTQVNVRGYVIYWIRTK